MKRRIGKGIALAFVAMVVCRAEVVAQGNPWNNPVVSPRVDTGGEVTFSVSAPSASRGGAFGTVYGRHMPDAERN